MTYTVQPRNQWHRKDKTGEWLVWLKEQDSGANIITFIKGHETPLITVKQSSKKIIERSTWKQCNLHYKIGA